MPNDLIIVDSPAAVGEAVAVRIAEAVEQRQGARFLLGCPTGRTPSPVFEPLARELARRGIDAGLITVVLMDEYLTSDLRLVDPAREYSCVGYAANFIAAPLRQACGNPPQIWHADPSDPGNYDRRIADAGGVDLFLLASGASDGHIAFNQPGADRGSITRIIELGEKTRQDNVSTWPSITSVDEVPGHGIGVGIATIVDQSRQAIMMLTGADKRHAFERVTRAAGYEPDWPATAVKEIENHTVIADLAAAGHPTH
ncbi:MAG: 6-phosphogluconolactonase [Propionicimonas sp.]|uniref:6-phosphogluconolactonase n=1 Tax=Propionicimonas sp. TaxID=1955623 RepID=UPI002B21DE55|nr:6-phosphogluconolactonase [Propionicimonas sp.]MEA4943043.1 6-phosphogluconolactonase [Propionicimonas sp.]MEA5054550.1 6-phosphogluconolactonase [Propionicimonas sp.]MEA5119303.1 6-phosphogluconolactonase [Propionicimonas sp.]